MRRKLVVDSKLMISVFFIFALSIPSMAQQMVVDGSSKEAYERSLKAMVQGMSDEDREAFARGLINLMVTRYPPASGAEGLGMLQFMEPAVEAAYITLDGTTRDEILEKGREIVAADAARTAAEQTPMQSDALRACLQNHVAVANAKIERASYGRTLSVDVTNNLPWAISGMRVEYVAVSKGRSVPWQKNDFSISISGGIEPGETRTIRTSTSQFPADAPDELMTVVTVLDVADPLERQIINDVTVVGWGEEASPMTCE